jgi:hypothetical protein
VVWERDFQRGDSESPVDLSHSPSVASRVLCVPFYLYQHTIYTTFCSH